MKMIEGFLRQWWRYWSMRWTAFWGLFVGWLVADRENMDAFMAMFPDSAHSFVGPILGFAIFATIGTARGVVQPKLVK